MNEPAAADSSADTASRTTRRLDVDAYPGERFPTRVCHDELQQRPRSRKRDGIDMRERPRFHLRLDGGDAERVHERSTNASVISAREHWRERESPRDVGGRDIIGTIEREHGVLGANQLVSAGHLNENLRTK